MPTTESPRYACDLILKGGITSGIVYPPAIAEIARDHRFRSIGGASAGAIGAASAAAAELGRASTTGGFKLLARVPEQLAATDGSGLTLLRRLFQPQPETKELFDLLWLARSTRGRARLRAMLSRLGQGGRAPGSWLTIIMLAFALAVAAAVIAYAIAGAGSLVASIPLVVLVFGAGYLARKIGQLYTRTTGLLAAAPVAVATNLHGMCNGSTPESSDTPGLTDWLYETLQALAGRNDDDVAPALRTTPVTYGELREREIDLVTISTDISHGTNEEFPFTRRGWAFKEAEMRELFPAGVVDHLVAHAEQTGDAEQSAALERDGLHLLPAADHVPIILGARISLSFPILLSAVPLYIWEPRLTEGGWQLCFQKCWFSDGGITSNLPVHLFDRPLPGRPTYAINLGGGGRPEASVWDNIWRPIEAGSGPPEVVPISSTVGFLSAVFNTMQNWADNSLARAAAQRDRICKIRLGPGEGGMNLDMPPKTISGLVERGGAAGMNLAWIQRGVTPPGAELRGVDPAKAQRQWDRHRFTRYRIFLAGLGRYLDDARTGTEQPSSPTYAELAEAAASETWLPYRKGWSLARNTKVAESQAKLFGLETDVMTNTPPAGSYLGYQPRSREEETV